MMVNQIMTGHLGDPDKIAALGITTSTVNIFVATVILGVNKALDVLCTQAFGNGDLRLCGEYLNRGRFIAFTLSIPPVLLLGIFAEDIALLFTRDENVIRLSAEYMIALLPAMLLHGQCDLIRKWLLRMRIGDIPMISNIIMIAIHIPMAYLFVYVLDMDMVGLAHALTCSMTITFFVLIGQVAYREDIKDAVFWPSWESFQHWGDYMKISLPIICLLAIFFIAQEVILVFAGLLGTLELAAQTQITLLITLLNVIAVGVQESTIIMLGNLIGENRAELAWRVYRFLVKVALVLYGLVAVFLLIFQNQYAYLMSDDEGVQDLLI